MGSLRDVLLLIMFLLITLCGSQPNNPDFNLLYKLCSKTSYTSNSIYGGNVNTLFHKVSSTNTQTYNGFYKYSAGQEPNTVYATAMCRGDLAAPDCHKCLNGLTSTLPKNCPQFKGAIGWSEYCMLQYSPSSKLEEVDFYPAYKLCNQQSVSHDVGRFKQALRALMGSLQKKAASGNSTLKFAYGRTNITGFNNTLYGLMQCTPDLNKTSCINCLRELNYDMQSMCPSKIGGRLYGSRCIMRYEEYEFLSNVSHPTPPPSMSTPPLSSQKPTSPRQPDSGRKRKYGEIIGVITVATASLLIFIVCLIACKRKTKHASDEDVSQIQTAQSLQFNLSQIKTATHNFSEDKKLGQGGFGAVYKGRLENGQEVAVKRLLKNSGHGTATFKTEAVLVAGLQHRNLVKLLGFCVSGREKILVYEYLPNSSLDKFLFDAAKQACLNWATRFKIICGIAKGLLYLHEESCLKIIHRDLKSSNILLDNDMNPKIADFGLARLLEVDQTQDQTDRIVGTYGYMAPEYAMTGHFSMKSDVYSFGIMVLEAVSGQKNRLINRSPVEEALLFRAWKLWNEGIGLELVDSCLGNSYSVEEVVKCIHIGLLCIQEDPSRRPNMASIVASLSGHSISFPSPTAPDFLSCSADAATSDNQVLENGMRVEGVTHTATESITEVYAR